MWIDLIVEYIGGFAFGLLIFQSLFMKDMMGGSYFKAVRHSLYPEWVVNEFHDGRNVPDYGAVDDGA